MRFATLSKLVTYLLAGLGLLALSFGGELSPLALALLAVGFVASYFAEGALIHSALWSRGITATLSVLLLVQLVRGFSAQGAWLALSMEFAGWLTVSRLCNRRNAQDHQQIAMLAFVQLIAATVLTTDLAYAALFLAFVIATPWTLTLAHLRAEVERNYPRENELRGGTDLGRVLASRRIVGPSFLLWTSLLSLPMLAMTLLLFVAFPRVGLGFVSLSGKHGQHVSGFGNNIELGGFGRIRDDPTVVVRVSANRLLSPQEQAKLLRLRGTAFDHYDGRRWTRSEGTAVRMSPITDYYSLRRMQSPSDLVLKVVLERLDSPVLFLPTGTVGVRLPVRGIPGVMRNAVGVLRGHGLDLRYESNDEMGLIYDAIVSQSPTDDDLPVARDTDDDRYLQLPGGHERVVALARRLRGDLQDPLLIAHRFETYLRDNDRFHYSLEQPELHGKPPLEAFLFDAKRGHCEYFATALAIMLRSVGIPSRNVTGFVGGEYNQFGGYYGLRQADAHSWVEALLSDRGWVILDPTPASSDRYIRERLFASVNAMIDAMRAYWMTRVVGYDLRTQIGAVRTLSEMWRRWSFPQFSWAGKSGSGSSQTKSASPSQLGPLALMLVAVLVLLGVGVWALLRLRQRKQARRLNESALAARKLYQELELVLSRKGRARAQHVTAEAHARELEQTGFAGAALVRELTQSYVEARYGGATLSEARLRELRKLLGEIKRAA
jgi:transglutaminase-like putative cysteine protease